MSIVYIISAPSGSGKSTLTNELLTSVPGLQFSVSYTTRSPRGSEQNGREYQFISRREFEEMIEANEFLEHACVFGDYYGTSRRFLTEARSAGNDLVLDIDVQGAAQIKKNLPEAVSIFILPPSRGELEKRLRRRNDTEKQLETADRRRSDQERNGIIEKRLQTAAKEIENFPMYDYILINDRLEQSIDCLKAIVLAERLTRSGKKLSSEDEQIVNAAQKCLLTNVREKVLGILNSFAGKTGQEEAVAADTR
jgi:guanylate kinase